MKLFESFTLDTANACLWRNGAQVQVAPKPFALLRYLVEHAGRLISHDELLDAVWPETYVQPQVLRTYVLELRKLLGDDAEQPRFIQTLPKRGYCFVATVVDTASQDPSPRNASLHAVEPRIELSGRDEECKHLEAQLEAVSRGQRRVVFITGEAGMGKTALTDAFCQRIAASLRGMVARGQCVEGVGAKEEYYPVMEALSHLCASPDGERACGILASIAPAWLTTRWAKPGMTTTPSTSAQDAARMPGDLCQALEELATEKPLVLVFEDLAWADASTLHLLSALARRQSPAKLMVLATYKPQDLAATDAVVQSTSHLLKGLKQDLVMRRLCTELALQPLPRAAIQSLMSRELDYTVLPSGLAGFVHQRSEGNPLFAIALLEHLIAQRFLVRAESGWKQCATFGEMEADVPDGLAQMIELQIDRLSLAEQQLLEAGSLIRVAFPAWAVAAALERESAETEEACDRLARRLYFLKRAWLDELPDGTPSAFYMFSHGLFREVLYSRQAEKQRARRHVRVAQRLAAMFDGSARNVTREVAFHYEAAGDWQQAVSALRSAAHHAQMRQAFAEAADLLEHTMRIARNLPELERVGTESELRHELTVVQESLSREAAVPLKA